ncbi:MAG: hypothetical protein QMC90_00150 [Dehalococcoidales bacterium]|nr:hypothetical protein [Dehalococcoidales bacterium]
MPRAYQLQEVDLELESNEQALNQIASQLGENQTVVRAQTEFTLAHQRLEELSGSNIPQNGR